MSSIKYPRTQHFHYSEKLGSDDRQCTDDQHFKNRRTICSLKMDGENSSLYSIKSHARSLSSLIDSEDRRWLDAFRISKIENKIPDNYRICGENMFYQHTCQYKDLESMFYAFSIWDGETCLSWDDTTSMCSSLGILHVPIIYDGIYDKDAILKAFENYIKISENDVEGFVVRLADSYKLEDFPTSVSKYVRKSFVIPDKHWRHGKKTQNQLKDGLNPWNIL